MNVLIIGYGSIAKKHISILKRIKKIKLIELVTSQKVNVFKTYEKIKQTNLDKYEYIIIASPTNRHHKELQYIDKNCKNKIILVEKPIFMDNQRLNIKNNKVFVAYCLRFTKILTKIRKLIHSQKVLCANVYAGSYLPNWREGIDYSKRYSAIKNQGGGVLLDLSHEIDYLRWIFGDFKNIKSLSRKISDLNIDSDDIMSLIASSKHNTVINCTIDYLSKISKRDILIHTNECTINADMIKGKIIQVYNDGRKKEFSFKNDIQKSYKRMHKSIIENKFDKICTFNDSISTLKTIEKIRKNG